MVAPIAAEEAVYCMVIYLNWPMTSIAPCGFRPVWILLGCKPSTYSAKFGMPSPSGSAPAPEMLGSRIAFVPQMRARHASKDRRVGWPLGMPPGIAEAVQFVGCA